MTGFIGLMIIMFLGAVYVGNEFAKDLWGFNLFRRTRRKAVPPTRSRAAVPAVSHLPEATVE